MWLRTGQRRDQGLIQWWVHSCLQKLTHQIIHVCCMLLCNVVYVQWRLCWYSLIEDQSVIKENEHSLSDMSCSSCTMQIYIFFNYIVIYTHTYVQCKGIVVRCDTILPTIVSYISSLVPIPSLPLTKWLQKGWSGIFGLIPWFLPAQNLLANWIAAWSRVYQNHMQNS